MRSMSNQTPPEWRNRLTDICDELMGFKIRCHHCGQLFEADAEDTKSLRDHLAELKEKYGD